ncbi:MAG: hypothetical protein ABII72_02385 [Parcubacteria group bacterium]
MQLAKNSRPEWWPRTENKMRIFVLAIMRLKLVKRSTPYGMVHQIPTDIMCSLPPELLKLNERQLGQYLMEVLIPQVHQKYHVAHPRSNHPLNLESHSGKMVFVKIITDRGCGNEERTVLMWKYPPKKGLKNWRDWLSKGS